MKYQLSRKLCREVVSTKARGLRSNWGLTSFNFMIACLGFCLLTSSCKKKSNIEAALIQQNWQQVFDECKKDDPSLKNVETIGILGHAAIMLNRNNVSFMLLSSIDADSIKRKGWQRWADSFARAFPGQAIACYFQGDAYMRNGENKEALKCFSQAIAIDPKFALAYDARGVLYTVEKDKDRALSDLNAACLLGADVSEFFANRGTMFYDNKAPEAASKDFTTALNISKNNAFALNGKACSKLFDFHEIYDKNLIDSIFYYWYNASASLNIRFLNDNKRRLMLQVENQIFPDQKETPFFKASDFLDWDSLRRRSLTDKYDLFRCILKKPLPAVVDAPTIIKINALETNPDIFKSYLNDSQIPDSLKLIITQTTKNIAKKGTNPKEPAEYQSRMVFEQYYAGLIAPFRKRDAGMSLREANRSMIDKIQNTFDYAENSYSHPNYLSKIDLNDVSLGRFGSFSANASDLAQAGIHAANALFITPFTIAQNRATASAMDANTRNAIDRPEFNPVARYNIQQSMDRDQGGAIADIRRRSVDNDDPYFLICINGLGYGAK